MYTYVTLDSDQDVNLEFDRTNNKRILEKFKNWNDKSHEYSNEEMEKLEESLDMLYHYPTTFQVEANVDEVELSENTIEDAYKDIHSYEGSYDDGYEDGISHIRKYKQDIQYKYNILFQKLEHLCFNYGKQEELTKDELKIIRDLLHYEYGDGAI